MSYLALVPLLLLTILLQTSVAPHFALLDIKPDLVLIFVAIWGTARGLQEAVAGGVLGGILLDIISGAPLGITTIAMLPISLIAGQSKTFFLGNRLALALAIVFFGTFIYDSIFLFILQSLGRETEWLASLARIFLPAAILNSLIAPLPFWVLSHFTKPVL